MKELKEKVVTCLRILERRGWADMTGHVSIRWEGLFFINEANASRYSLTADQVVTVSLDGTVEGGTPPLETPIHLCIYRAQPEVGAIIHFHPPVATVLSLTNGYFPAACISGAHLGPVAFYNYPGRIDNEEEAEKLQAVIRGRRACLLRGHGAVVVGANIEEALAAAYYLEDNAVKLRDAMSIEGATLLTEEEVKLISRNSWQPEVIRRLWDYEVSKLSPSAAKHGLITR